MRVTLLGTAAASGWPNPWCKCASCEWMRANNDVRGQTSAVVDGTLWIDCGPEAPRAAERLGVRSSDVTHLLFTHAHPDHTGPARLMWREWTHPDRPLDVAGPQAVVEECHRWVGPDAAIKWHVLHAGDDVELGAHRVRAIAAAHGDESIGPALLYDVTGPDGIRMLWATDTAPLSDTTLDTLTGAAFDALFLEQTNGDDYDADTDHLDLVTWPRQIAALRRRGAVTDTTTVIPVHLGHGNPPPPRLRQRMSAWGARVPDDGDTIEVGATTANQPPATAHRVLVLGGARSGKSRWAESLLADRDDVVYVATSYQRPDDDEWQQRVAAHRARRPAEWTTLETLELAKAMATHDVVLVDCLTLWLGALLDEPDLPGRVDELVGAVKSAGGTMVLVSNEVGDGVVPVSEPGRRFRDELGSLNARLAAVCDEVWLVTAGIPRRLA
jgi:adenosylcobinamide kinase/adenosylcobinamide-phosphate guanylyltransferase